MSDKAAAILAIAYVLIFIVIHMWMGFEVQFRSDEIWYN
jgi:preprotein translocase subunit SecF